MSRATERPQVYGLITGTRPFLNSLRSIKNLQAATFLEALWINDIYNGNNDAYPHDSSTMFRPNKVKQVTLEA